MPSFRFVLTIVLLGAALQACASSPEAEERRRQQRANPGIEDLASERRVLEASVRTVQLFQTASEASLPVLQLGSGQTLTLAFDILTDEAGRPLEVSFVHTDREGEERLLPTEYMTGFERDFIQDYVQSGSPSVNYVHYSYDFPNATIDFRLSGNFSVRVRNADGKLIIDEPFFVAENLAAVTLAYGATLAGGQSSGLSIQPAARLEPGPQLSQYQAYQYTVCFARDGRLDVLRCAPEPSLVQQTLFQYYLPADQAFGPSPPRFEFNIGLLGLSDQVVDVDRVARPPTATLDVDNAEFGGEVTGATLSDAPIISTVFRDVGSPDTDAEYVAVRFRYAPANRLQSGRPVYVVGSFNGWRTDPANAMIWNVEERLYEAVMIVKQGAYVYGYSSPGGPPIRGAAIGQSGVFTALVYLADPALFSDRLVAVESIVTR